MYEIDRCEGFSTVFQDILSKFLQNINENEEKNSVNLEAGIRSWRPGCGRKGGRSRPGVRQNCKGGRRINNEKIKRKVIMKYLVK